jgi:BirA family transcriptional regulator, biotin operon repressor / biotin---[acetyl-CoA-carboxylase] ligase
MISNTDILSILADGRFHSGEDLGAKLFVSRSAIWKKIRNLQRLGMEIYSVKGKGYRINNPVELLDKKKILSLLDKNTVPLLGNLTVHSLINSTNQYLLEKLNDPAFHKHVSLAEYQTAGRGRRGNKWISPFASGISMSVAWHFNNPPEPVAGISLGAGVAVLRMLQKLGINGAGVKWPNDIYYAGCKLGGTLVEIQAESEGPFNVIIGIGINYSFPAIDKGIDQPWIDIARIQQPIPSRNLIVAKLIAELFQLLQQADKTGFGSVIEEWRSYDCMQGRTATLILPDTQVTGQVIGVDDSGALLISMNNRIKKFNSGEISLKIFDNVSG